MREIYKLRGRLTEESFIVKFGNRSKVLEEGAKDVVIMRHLNSINKVRKIDLSNYPITPEVLIPLEIYAPNIEHIKSSYEFINYAEPFKTLTFFKNLKSLEIQGSFPIHSLAS